MEACVHWVLEGGFELHWDLGEDSATGRVGPWVVARVLPYNLPWQAPSPPTRAERGINPHGYRVEILLPGLLGCGRMESWADMVVAIQACSTVVSRWFREGLKGFSEASGGEQPADGGT